MIPVEELTEIQTDLVGLPVNAKIFLEGNPGCGKTTAAVYRLNALLSQGVPADQILVLTPQRTLSTPYIESLYTSEIHTGGLVSTITLGGLAQRMIQLFWPLFAEKAGFAHPENPPTFLTLETAQYFIARVLQPLLDEGYFEQVALDRNRLYSQILDNLNKSAVVGFAHTGLAERLKNAWIGVPSQLIVYDQVQECANRFRAYCLENNLLDFSLQFEMFAQILWPDETVRAYLSGQYRHLIFDNIEEDVPVAHDILREWLPAFKSALLIYDNGGGNRVFLGADPDYAYSLKDTCEIHLGWHGSFTTSPDLITFQHALDRSLNHELNELPAGDIEEAFDYYGLRFFTEMVDKVCAEISRLVEVEKVSPGDIAILTPYLSDALRHAFTNRLAQNDIPTRSIRPSRSLQDEPAAGALMTLAYLAHPDWNVLPTRADFRGMLLQTIQGIDLVRAELLTGVLYRYRNLPEPLGDYDQVNPSMQERITYTIGERYSRLRAWLLEYRSGEPAELDVFLSRLFGEILSQPGFGFHDNFDAAGVTARLIESIQKFRRVVENSLPETTRSVGQEYLDMVKAGVISSQYLQSYRSEGDAVLIAPAYTFIMANQAVGCQFWLDIGSQGWWERLYQPLTQPYVLSRKWPSDHLWTDLNETAANQETLARLVYGLISRCRRHVYLCSTRINERGSEERGQLLQALNTILHLLFVENGGDHV